MNATVFAVEEASNTRIAWFLVAAVVLLVLNALFVAYEFALLAAKRQTIEAEAEEGGRAAVAAANAMGNVSVHLAGAQLGITMCTVGLGFVAEPAVASLLLKFLDGPLAHGVAVFVSIAIALSVVTFLHLVGAEMVPKNIAIAAAEPTLKWTVLPYVAYLRIFRPAVRFLNWIANLGCRLVGVEPRDELVAAPDTNELAAIVGHSGSEGAIETDDADFLRSAISFAERPVHEIARPLTPASSIRRGSTFRNARDIAVASGGQRVPMVARIGSNVVLGYLHARDLLGLDDRDLGGIVPNDALRPMAVFDGSTPMIAVVRQMRAGRNHLAQVRMPDGGAAVVSIEEVVAGLASEPPELDPSSMPTGGHH